ncbi:MAG: cell division protein FtsZ [Bacteroidales bacterium]|nr:cell division protein FtsZ [Bacteroidales bacterium]
MEAYDFPQAKSSIIKVIGVGGGGGNAVTHMYNEGIHDVSFAICNTDNQALQKSPVPTKIQLGHEGLGAGNRPAKAREAAEESIDEIDALLSDGTKMVFITAGMGGGTGTGAAPVIARKAREKDILTVGIVTIPFLWEGKNKINQALDGVEEINKEVDALLVINNERLLEINPNLSIRENFSKADDTLTTAAKSIAEIITIEGEINLDFNDVKTVMKDGGVALMSTGYGEGEHRVTVAIDNALNSPLLNHKNVFNSQKVLLNFSYSTQCEMMTEEMNEITSFMEKFQRDYELKWGLYIDDELGSQIRVTILATGFDIDDVTDSETISQYKNEQTQQALKINQEEESRKEARMEKYYDGGTSRRGTNKKHYNIYLFSAASIDNERVINLVENSPTYSRSSHMLSSLHSSSIVS